MTVSLSIHLVMASTAFASWCLTIFTASAQEVFLIVFLIFSRVLNPPWLMWSGQGVPRLLNAPERIKIKLMGASWNSAFGLNVVTNT